MIPNPWMPCCGPLSRGASPHVMSGRLGNWPSELTGRSCLLTGASGGVGHALARHFTGAGVRLALAYGSTGVEDLLEELSADDLRHVSIHADLRHADAVHNLSEQAAR